MTRRFNIIDRLIPIGIDVNREMNMREHSTDNYDLSGIVLRRGKVFSSVITLNQIFDNDKYQFAIIFKSITWRNSPDIRIPFDTSSNGWSVDTIVYEKEIYMQIQSSADALIGKYAILLEIKAKDEDQYSLFQFDIDIYFLCNPWLNEDACGRLSSDEINEYVMNDYGKIFLNSLHVPKTIHWHFGQFQNIVLQTALSILNREQVSSNEQINLSFILRILAENVYGRSSSITDYTSLISQEYGDTSTPSILNRFSLPNNPSTNWQHAAIFCSLCRSLGIPSRIVTMFDKNIEQQNQNSWYIWSECWIQVENFEWHFIDSTSLELETRNVGPRPVSSIKNLLNTENMKILTKSLNKNQDLEDITNNFKSLNISQQDVQIDVNVDDNFKFENQLDLILSTNNRSDQNRTLSVEIKLNQLSPASDQKYICIHLFSQTFNLNSYQSRINRLKLTDNYQLWQEHFHEQLQLDIRVIVKETDQVYHAEKYILNEYNTTMKLFFDDDIIEFGQSARLNIQINNISFHSWNTGEITVNGFGVFECFPMKRESVPKTSILISTEIVPLRKGISQVYVTFKTDSISLPTQTILLEVTECLNRDQNEQKNMKLFESTKPSLIKIPSLENLFEIKSRQLPKVPSIDDLTELKTSIKRKLIKVPSLENIPEAINQEQIRTGNKSNESRQGLYACYDIETDKNVTLIPIVNNGKQNDIKSFTQTTRDKATEQVTSAMDLNDWLEEASRNLLTNNQSEQKSIDSNKIEIPEEIKQISINKSSSKPTRSYSNNTIDLESILSDPSQITTMSDHSSASEDEDLIDRQRAYTIIENRNTRSETMSTIKNRESSSSTDDLTSDPNSQLSNSTSKAVSLYAEFLACKIIGSAVYTNRTYAVSNPLYDSS